jgi:hypothetical protein
LVSIRVSRVSRLNMCTRQQICPLCVSPLDACGNMKTKCNHFKREEAVGECNYRYAKQRSDQGRSNCAKFARCTRAERREKSMKDIKGTSYKKNTRTTKRTRDKSLTRRKRKGMNHDAEMHTLVCYVGIAHSERYVP